MNIRDHFFVYFVYPFISIILRFKIGQFIVETKEYFSLNLEGRREWRRTRLEKTLAILSISYSGGLRDMLDGLEYYTKSELRANRPRRGEYAVVRETAGTTGLPVVVGLTKDDIGRQLAVRRFWFESMGIFYGEHEFRAWGRRGDGWRSKIRNLVLNRTVCNVMEEGADAALLKLINSRAVYIYGYSSMILRLAQHVHFCSKDSRPKLKAVICTAETLYPAHQAFIESVFECPCVMEYGSTEFDIIAFQCKHHHYHEASPWIVVEKSSNGLIVTDISRTGQPLLRYAIGDDADGDQITHCDCGLGNTVFDRVAGRTLNQEIKFPDGTHKHAVLLAYAAEDAIRETGSAFFFHAVQMNDLTVDVFIDPESLNGAEDRSKVVSIFNRYLSPLPLNVKFVKSELAVTAKRTYFTSMID